MTGLWPISARFQMRVFLQPVFGFLKRKIEMRLNTIALLLIPYDPLSANTSSGSTVHLAMDVPSVWMAQGLLPTADMRLDSDNIRSTENGKRALKAPAARKIIPGYNLGARDISGSRGLRFSLQKRPLQESREQI